MLMYPKLIVWWITGYITFILKVLNITETRLVRKRYQPNITTII